MNLRNKLLSSYSISNHQSSALLQGCANRRAQSAASHALAEARSNIRSAVVPRNETPPKRIRSVTRRAGELLPGEQIPSVPKLVKTYGVRRNTALRALRVLRA